MYNWWNEQLQSWWQQGFSHSYVQCLASEDSKPSENYKHINTGNTESTESSATSLSPKNSVSASKASEINIQDWPFEQALCVLNEGLECAEVSKNFARVTSTNSSSLSQPFLSLIREDGRSHFLFCLQEILLSDVTRMQPMMRVRMAKQPEHWLHISGMRHHHGVMLCLRDITQEMSLERELVRARINAELAQRARSEFLGRMSHELRTPLNAVIGFSQMIDEEVSGPLEHPVYSEYLSSIRQSGEQLLDKINNLLAISEAELGGVELQEEVVLLSDLMRNASEHHQHFAFSKDVQLDLMIDEATSPSVRVDKTLMAKALSNLIENAIACTKSGGGVRLECEVDDSGELLIHIRDTGVGMNESLVRCLSDFFNGCYSSHNYYERIPLGTGLMLTREYVQLHDGSLQVRSEKGFGTVLTVQLPAKRRIRNSRIHPRDMRYELLEALAL